MYLTQILFIVGHHMHSLLFSHVVLISGWSYEIVIALFGSISLMYHVFCLQNRINHECMLHVGAF